SCVDRFLEHRTQCVAQGGRLPATESAGSASRPDAGTEQGFDRVDVAHTRDATLIEQPVADRGDGRAGELVQTLGGEVIRQRLHTEFCVALDPSGIVAQVEVTEAARVVVQDGAPITEVESHRDVAQLAGARGIARHDTAGHAEIYDEAESCIELDYHVLAAPRYTGDRAAAQASPQEGGRESLVQHV